MGYDYLHRNRKTEDQLGNTPIEEFYNLWLNSPNGESRYPYLRALQNAQGRPIELPSYTDNLFEGLRNRWDVLEPNETPYEALDIARFNVRPNGLLTIEFIVQDDNLRVIDRSPLYVCGVTYNVQIAEKAGELWAALGNERRGDIPVGWFKGDALVREFSRQLIR